MNTALRVVIVHVNIVFSLLQILVDIISFDIQIC